MTFLCQGKDGALLLALHVQPKSSKNRISGLHGEDLKLNITAPPVDGKANKAIIHFLADFFKLPKSAVIVKSGLQGRKKRILLTGITQLQARQKIEAVIGLK